MRDLPGPGLEPVSPALAGGFLTTAPPGKSQEGSFYESSDHFGSVAAEVIGENFTFIYGHTTGKSGRRLLQ